MLGHSNNQEGADPGANQGSEETEYDDLQSMLPFGEEEQRFKGLTRQDVGKEDNDDAGNQRQLVTWTKVLAWTTGGLAVATAVVAFFAAWGIGRHASAR